MLDESPRPYKRARLDSSPMMPTSSLSTLTSAPSSPSKSQGPHLKPLPPAILLVSLPSLIAHPPTHRLYIPSLCISLCALRRCLKIPALSPEIECRAWTGLAEIGIRTIGGGLHESEDHLWARGIEAEVDRALSKASILAQKHPSLRAYKHTVALLQIQLSHWQHKIKYARTQVRNLLSSFLPADSPHVVYAAHLAAISIYTTPKPAPAPSNQSPSRSQSSRPTYTSPNPVSPAYSQSPQDIHAALASVSEMETYSLTHSHKRITLLVQVLRLRILVAADMWTQVSEALARVESALGLSYEPAVTPKPRSPDGVSATPRAEGRKPEEFIFFEDAFEAAMAVHTLMMGIVYFTHAGSHAEASPRLSHLHALLDSGALDKFSEGIVEVKLPTGPPLTVQVTHPRVLYLLAFLVSSVAKRDAVGRKPKRRVFAVEGLVSWEKELNQEMQMSPWASLGDVEEVEQRLARIKADLLCELVAVSIMRSEFDVAEENLAALIAHTRTYSLFPLFAARISLHHGHLAHALSQTARALDCYRVAASLSPEDSFVGLSARAGEIVLRIGVHGKGEMDGIESVDMKEAMVVACRCRSMGGTLEAVGAVIEALISGEILKAKQRLKHALELATRAQDNYLRAAILALVAAHYFHTAGDHALSMLNACEQIAAGLGAPAKKPTAEGQASPAKAAVGNARLGLWVGQKYLELYKRAGKEHRVQKQLGANERLEEAVRALEVRSRSGN